MRRAVAAVGFGALLVGFASLLLRATFGFSLNYTFVTMVGLLAAAQGLRYASARRGIETVETETGDPEQRYQVPTPGDDFDARLAGAGGWSLRGVSERRTIRERLHSAAVDALVIHDNCPIDEAERRIREGTWTDDPYAVDFLGDAPTRPPLGLRLRGLFSREPKYHRQVRHTVDAIVALQEDKR